jgi:hypothetical protein
MDQVMSPHFIDRRRALTGLATGGAALFLAGCSGNGGKGEKGPMATLLGKSGPSDVDSKIMTFALNLEYMEAEYYTRGAYGHSLAEHGVATGRSPGEVRGGHKVAFSNSFFQDFAEELSYNEAAHVKFYREQLGGAAVDLPAIDFEGGFAQAAAAAGLVRPGEPFDPFADEINFFLGGMLFEDVGVTAYHGAAKLITSKEVLDAAAGILAVEAYHMGAARTILYQAGPKAQHAANAISDARDALDGPQDLDQGIEMNGKANIVPNDRRGIAFARTPRQVLNIVYLKPGAMNGGFYPNGMNGDLSGLL